MFKKRNCTENRPLCYGAGVDKEVTITEGSRVDAIDFANGIIYELKPNNARARNRGYRQLHRYVLAAQERYGGQWTGVLVLYN